MGRASRRREAEASAAAQDAAPRREVPAKPGWLTLALVVLLAASALFRVAYCFQYRAESVLYHEPILDARIYDEWARGIAGGDLRPDEPFYFAPGYPYALAFIYRFISGEKGAVYTIQLALGLANIFLIHRLAWSAFGRRTAFFAALGTRAGPEHEPERA